MIREPHSRKFYTWEKVAMAVTLSWLVLALATAIWLVYSTFSDPESGLLELGAAIGSGIVIVVMFGGLGFVVIFQSVAWAAGLVGRYFTGRIPAPPYTERDWNIDTHTVEAGHSLRCPECRSDTGFGPKNDLGATGTFRFYRECGSCGFLQEADGSATAQVRVRRLRDLTLWDL